MGAIPELAEACRPTLSRRRDTASLRATYRRLPRSDFISFAVAAVAGVPAASTKKYRRTAPAAPCPWSSTTASPAAGSDTRAPS